VTGGLTEEALPNSIRIVPEAVRLDLQPATRTKAIENPRNREEARCARAGISRQLMAIRPILLNPEFLMIFLQTMSLYFQAKSIGIAIPGIGREDVTHAEFGLPPLAEQSRIVTRITALRHLCADLRQRLAERQSVQARLAEALVQEVA